MSRSISIAIFAGLLATGYVVVVQRPPQANQVVAAEPTAPQATVDPRDRDLALLKDKACDQAHAMVSVAYHYNNMWFAAQHENWPLAELYWNETRSHLRWAVRIIPVRTDAAGQEVKLGEILQALENTPLKQLKDAISAKDRGEFEMRYKMTLEGCYACHKAADKPFLRPGIPTQPAEPAINFDPAADWPR